MTTTHKPLSRWFVLLLAVTTGVTVASNYYAQPLLHTISNDLHVSTSSVGIIITVAQLSYAAGLLLLVPLGDLIERRFLIISMTCASIVGLLISASAQSIFWLLTGTAVAGFFAVVAQVVMPFGTSLAAPSEQGKVLGTLMGGLLLGILLARTAAGFSSTLGSWRTIYMVAAVVLSIITLLLYKTLPRYPAVNKMPYHHLLASTLGQFIKYPTLILYGLLGALNFAVFSTLWTPITLLLAGTPYHYSDAIIGLFGLVGAAGALVAPYAGKLADEGKSNQVITVGFILLVLSWLALGLATTSLALLIIGVLVLDLAVQVIHVTSMNQVYLLNPTSRNRLNACYMVCYFIGGAASSLVSTHIYAKWQWLGVSITGASISILGLLIWLALHPKKAKQLLPDNYSKETLF